MVVMRRELFDGWFMFWHPLGCREDVDGMEVGREGGREGGRELWNLKTKKWGLSAVDEKQISTPQGIPHFFFFFPSARQGRGYTKKTV